MAKTSLTGRIVTPLAADESHTAQFTEPQEPTVATITVDSSGLVTSITPVDDADFATDAELPLITPGFVDLHNHGGDGGAFPTGDEAACRAAALYHRRHGTVALLASMVSQTEAEISQQLKTLVPLAEEGLIAGIHLEGPFINIARKGAQSPDRIIAGNPGILRRLFEQGQGHIRQITFAPETDNAREIIDLCAEYGVIVSFGHTDADFDTAASVISYAVEAGTTITATHLFNAMPPLHHRAPGAAAAFLEAASRGEMYVELIADGVHLADGTVDMVTGLAPRFSFAVTDAIEAAGLADGNYILGPLDVIVDNGIARLRTADGTEGSIAGGTSTMAQQFLRFSKRHGYAAAARFTSTNGAKVLGKTELTKGIHIDQPANLVVMQPDGRVQQVLANGREISVF